MTPTPSPTPTWPLVCHTAVHGGNDVIEVRAQYAHDNPPGTPYAVRLGPVVVEHDGIAEIRAEGSPTGCDWTFVDIFADGFESGDAGAWSTVLP